MYNCTILMKLKTKFKKKIRKMLNLWLYIECTLAPFKLDFFSVLSPLIFFGCTNEVPHGGVA